MRKKYCKPEIKAVELKAEEAVLGACKADINQTTGVLNVGGKCVSKGQNCSTLGT